MIAALLRTGYRLVERVLEAVGIPARKIGLYHGIPVRKLHLLAREDVDHEHEAALIAGIRRAVREGDRVVLVGAGSGASTVAAARRAGREGRVVAFEASERMSRFLRDTVRLNRVEGIVEPRHGVVAEPGATSGDAGGTTRVPTSELPECDVLVMDCEGAEEKILGELEVTPRAVVVETHAHLGSPADRIRELLAAGGWTEVEVLPHRSGPELDVLLARRGSSRNPDAAGGEGERLHQSGPSS